MVGHRSAACLPACLPACLWRAAYCLLGVTKLVCRYMVYYDFGSIASWVYGTEGAAFCFAGWLSCLGSRGMASVW